MGLGGSDLDVLDAEVLAGLPGDGGLAGDGLEIGTSARCLITGLDYQFVLPSILPSALPTGSPGRSYPAPPRELSTGGPSVQGGRGVCMTYLSFGGRHVGDSYVRRAVLNAGRMSTLMGRDRSYVGRSGGKGDVPLMRAAGRGPSSFHVGALGWFCWITPPAVARVRGLAVAAVFSGRARQVLGGLAGRGGKYVRIALTTFSDVPPA
jgi:hypothetical protein